MEKPTLSKKRTELGDIISNKIEQMISERKTIPDLSEIFDSGEKEYKDEDIDKLVSILNKS